MEPGEKTTQSSRGKPQLKRSAAASSLPVQAAETDSGQVLLPGSRHPLIAFTVLVLLGVLLYSNALNVPFIFDDKPNITQNPHIRMTRLSPEQIVRVKNSINSQRLFAHFTFALNYYFHRYHVTGYHLVNIGIHIITSFLVFPHPARLNLDHDIPVSHSLTEPVTTLLSLLFLCGLVLVALFTANRYRLVSFAILWFLGNLAIESSFIPLELFFEHRTYLPSVFVFIAVTWLLCRALKDQRLVPAVVCPIVCLSGFWTYQRNAVWRTELSLWQDCVNKSPQKERTHYNMGVALSSTGRIKEAAYNLQRLRSDLSKGGESTEGTVRNAPLEQFRETACSVPIHARWTGAK